ncbi:DUF3617 domain-containing protein [Sphingomonas sp. MMS12-HWE2-04]|uniref:DUF3617 domain-containing protein n=1 Tax=Sphingomonas sp. MMS12-HWE2-04 TaxID=3234199 RepID=UPI00384FDAD9
MRVFALALILTLAACQSAAEKHAAETGEINVTNASADEVAGLIKAASAKNAAKPGEWKAELRIEAVEAASGDNAAQLQMAKSLEKSATECRTAEQLRPFEVNKLERAAGGACTFLRYTAIGGKVAAQIECKKPNAPVTTIAINGTSSATAFDVVTENVSGAKGQPGYSRVRLRSTGTRIGECAAKAG